MKIIIGILISVLLVNCSADIYKNVNINELQYPSELKVIQRVDWGWTNLEYVIDEHEIEYITIHHGGVDFPEDRNVIEYLRGLQSWSRNEKKWIDIPYHFMIDFQGNIYEARPINYPGDTNTNYNPSGHALVNVIGNYENQVINEKQLDALVELCSYLSNEFSVDPDLIKGHKDYTDGTVCPGKDLYKYLEDKSIVNRVKSKVTR